MRKWIIFEYFAKSMNIIQKSLDIFKIKLYDYAHHL